MTTTEQKINNAIKWITGLTHTKLPQADGRLGNNTEGFCCLGYGCYRLKIEFDEDDADNSKFTKAVGLRSDIGKFYGGNYVEDKDKEGSIYDSLIELNDEAKFSFRKISTFLKKRADWIFEPEVAKGIKNHFNKIMDLKLKLKVLKRIREKLAETSEWADYSICRRLYSEQEYFNLNYYQLTNLTNEMHKRMSHTDIVWVHDTLRPTQIREIFKSWAKTKDQNYYLWHPNDFESRYLFLSAWINEIEKELDKRQNLS